MAEQSTTKETGKPRPRQTKVGRVVSNKMQKTVVVEVERTVLHPRYHRYIRRRSTFMAHDERGIAKPGDRVAIEETRPMSRHKRWAVREVLSKAEA